MTRIHHKLYELVGHTPLLELDNYEAALGIDAHIIGKLEYLNPTGSVKDRIAINMIETAEKEGRLKRGDTILDYTSGNTGIATASYANAKGYRYATVIQPGVSAERTLILRALGVTIYQAADVPGFPELLASGLSVEGLNNLFESFAREHGYYYISQCSNKANVLAHYEHTAPEIWEDTGGKVDYAVACVGTGGTLAGLSRYFKERNPKVRIIGVQPAEPSRRTPEHPNPNVIDGILVFNGVPNAAVLGFFDKDNPPYDEVIDVVAEDAYAAGRKVALTDGVFLGQSAGAALFAATQVARRKEARGKNIVAVLADNAFKYLSTQMYRLHDELHV